MRICSKCGHKNDDVNFCCVCGNDLRLSPAENRSCSNCGFSGNSVNNVFCSRCGNRLKEKSTKNILLIGLTSIVILLIAMTIFWLYATDRCMDDGTKGFAETPNQISSKLQERVEATIVPSANTLEETQETTISSVNIDMNCEHIFEVFNGKHKVETSCRFCGISMDDLNNAGITLPDIDCEHYYKIVIQTNGTPAYECEKCHNIRIYPFPTLTELKLLSDTNEQGKNDDVKYGTFYHNGWEWQNAVRFWVANKSGYNNTESMEVYLANAYTELYLVAFAAEESDNNTNMTLRFYGDGQLLYEMTDITKDSEEKDTRIDITDIEVLKVECLTQVDAFGYCILHGTVS